MLLFLDSHELFPISFASIPLKFGPFPTTDSVSQTVFFGVLLFQGGQDLRWNRLRFPELNPLKGFFANRIPGH